MRLNIFSYFTLNLITNIMKKYFNLTILIMFLFVLNFQYAIGQNENTSVDQKRVIVKLENGDEYRGIVILENEEEMILSTDNGEVTLETNQIKKIEEDNYEGKYDYENLSKTHYFLNSNSIPLKKKKGYFQNAYVGMNFVNYGLTKNVSIGGGLELSSLFNGSPFLFLSSKLRFSATKNIHFGASLLLVNIGDETFMLYYGAATFGNSDFNITTGIVSSKFTGFIIPTYNISVMYRMNNKLSLMSENYFLNYDQDIRFSFFGFSGSAIINLNIYFGIHGLRWMFKKNTLDFGVLSLQINDFVDSPILPYIGYSRNF